MTIVAGFKSYEGIVLCADTQETVGANKRNVPKLRFEPSKQQHEGVSGEALTACFCAATDNGVFADELIDRIWEEMQFATNIDEACESAKTAVKDHYREAVGLYHPGYVPSVELLYGVKIHTASKLFYSFGPSVVEKQSYAIGGQGGHIADFLASRMYKDHLSLRQCVILAAYILFQAKEHVEGCGGESHIALLRDDGGASGRVDWGRVEAITDLLKLSDERMGEILLGVADYEKTSAEFKQQTKTIIDIVEAFRDSRLYSLKNHIAFWRSMTTNPHLGLPPREEDEFGLRKP